MAPDSVVDITGDLEITQDGALTVWTAMEPLGVLTISTHGRGERVSGSVKVVSDGPLGGMLRFAHPEVGVAGVGASPPFSAALVPVRRQAGGIHTGMALHNLGKEPMEVSCQLMSGGVAVEETIIPLAANRPGLPVHRRGVSKRRYLGLRGVGALHRALQGTVHRNRRGYG